MNVHTGAAATDQGTIEGRAAETLRERARLCPGALILSDVHVKHATPLGSESLGQAAREALGRGLADAVVVSGRATGCAPEMADLRAAREAIEGVGTGRLLVGSGLDAGNAAELLSIADGAIVGTALKRDGRVDAPVDSERVRRLCARVAEMRRR